MNRTFPATNKPSGLRFLFPFNSDAVTNYNYQLQLQPVKLEFITGCFIDNSLNAQQFQLIMTDTGQKVTVPAYSQGFFELLGLSSDKVSIQGITTGNIDLTVTFLNYVPVSGTLIWSVIDPGTVIGAITVNGAVTAYPSASDSVDRSKSIAAANTPEQLMPANGSRRTANIFNPFANSALTNGGVLTVSFGTAKTYGQSGGYDIGPGGSFSLDGFGIPSEIVYISSTDAGAVVSAYEI